MLNKRALHLKTLIHTSVLFLGGMYFVFAGQNSSNVSIQFNPVYGNSALILDSSYINEKGEEIRFEALRFYISNVQLVFQDGSKHIESKSFHLMDMENPENFKIDVNTKNKPIAKILFSLGIDSITNVSGALDGDLDPAKGMYWAWQSGYVNFKLEGKSTKCKNTKHEFSYHIGGYLNPFYALRELEIPIQYQQNGTVKIEMNLDTLLSKIDLSKTNNVTIPGKEAMKIADYSQTIFSNN